MWCLGGNQLSHRRFVCHQNVTHFNRGAFMIDDDQSTSFFGRKPGWGHC